MAYSTATLSHSQTQISTIGFNVLLYTAFIDAMSHGLLILQDINLVITLIDQERLCHVRCARLLNPVWNKLCNF
jgi:hypothetical protein